MCYAVTWFDLAAWLPPFPANFLSEVGAVYAGIEQSVQGPREK
jgi:hypothetical protein